MASVLNRRRSLTIQVKGTRRVNVDKMGELLNAIQGYFETEKSKKYNQEINFHKLIDEAVACEKHRSSSPKLDINIRVNQSFPFYSDKLRISLILNHLIGNAIRFQDESKAENIIDIDINVNKIEATLEIIDNGEGIPKEIQKDIFKVFFKASEASEGFGIGLYVVEKCLDRLCGYININSSYGIGTHCIMKIPNNANKV